MDTQEIDLVAGCLFAGAGLRRQGGDAHAAHERADMTPTHVVPLLGQLPTQPARAHEGMLQMQFVNPAQDATCARAKNSATKSKGNAPNYSKCPK